MVKQIGVLTVYDAAQMLQYRTVMNTYLIAHGATVPDGVAADNVHGIYRVLDTDAGKFTVRFIANYDLTKPAPKGTPPHDKTIALYCKAHNTGKAYDKLGNHPCFNTYSGKYNFSAAGEITVEQAIVASIEHLQRLGLRAAKVPIEILESPTVRAIVEEYYDALVDEPMTVHQKQLRDNAAEAIANITVNRGAMMSPSDQGLIEKYDPQLALAIAGWVRFYEA